MGTITINGQPYTAMGLVADADTYLNAAVGAGADAWRALTGAGAADAKGRAIMAADRFLYALPWQGNPTVAAQSTAFPRDGVVDGAGTTVPNGTTPADVISAEYELAALIVADPTVLTQTSSGSNIKTLKAGPVELQYFIPTITIPGISTPLPVTVWRLIAQYLASSTAANSAGSAQAFGVDPCVDSFANSQFEDCDAFTRVIR